MARKPFMVPATLVLCALASADPGNGQAPVITPAGDPSVRSDTIYRLAVSPADYPEDGHVLLLDDGVVRLERDGTNERTYRMVAQVLRTDAIGTWAEHTFSYDALREEFRLNWARVVDADGTVVAERPLHIQESDAQVPESYPVYTRRKVVRVSLSNVAAGRIVDYSYTVVEKDPVLPGDFYAGWYINPGVPVQRSRLIVDLPTGLEARIREENLDFAPQVRRTGGRVVRTWSRAGIEGFEPELFAADSNGYSQSVTVTGAVGWGDIAGWYAALASGRYELTPALEEALAGVVAAAATRTDSLRALHRWIAQDVRYVSLSLGIGGYQPRPPGEVLATMSGDCKDKATLFVALARRLGYDAFPLLVAGSGRAVRALPSLAQFDHMIAAIRTGAGDWTYVDLTADIIPFGDLPPAVAGEFGLLVYDDGGFEEVEFPQLNSGANRLRRTVDGQLTEDGRFEGRFRLATTGFLQYDLRSTLSQTFEGRARTEFAHNLASTVIAGARGEELEIFDGFDLAAVPEIGLRLVAERQLTRAGDGWLFKLPVSTYAVGRLADALEREPARRSPFDVESVLGPQVQESVLSLTVPDGWVAVLPESFVAESAFGRYAATYRQKGNRLMVQRVMSGGTGILPPERKTELVEWLRRVAEDDASFIMLMPPRS